MLPWRYRTRSSEAVLNHHLPPPPPPPPPPRPGGPLQSRSTSALRQPQSPQAARAKLIQSTYSVLSPPPPQERNPPHRWNQPVSSLRPRMPGGACQRQVRPPRYSDRSVVTPLYTPSKQDMYKNDAYYHDYGTKDYGSKDVGGNYGTPSKDVGNYATSKDVSAYAGNSKDVSYQPSTTSMNNTSQSTGDYTTSDNMSKDKRPTPRDQVPSYYYKDYVPCNSIPQTPTTLSDNVFTTTPLSTTAASRMNGYVRNKSVSSMKPPIPDSPESKDSKNASQDGKMVQRFIPIVNLYGVHSNAAAIGLTSILSLALGILAMQLLFTMGSKTTKDFEGKIVNEIIYEVLYQAVVALASVVLMLNLTCTLICTMQCFFVVRLLKLKRGYRRAFRYLKDCAAVRLISTTGFFMSIPTFFAALIMYCMMELRMTAAIIASVIIGLGVVLCLAAYVETIVHLARNRTVGEDEDEDEAEERKAQTAMYGLCQTELSTLV